MIAFLCDGEPMAAAARSVLLTRALRVVDGPFIAFAEWDPDAAARRVYLAGATQDRFYAAGRAAVMRGATSLVALSLAVADRQWARDVGVAPGEMVSVTESFDLSALAGVQAILPDRSTELPVVPPAPGAGVRLGEEATNEGVRLGSLSRPLTASLLGRHLYREYGIGLFDTALRGAVDAGRDDGIPVLGCAVIEGWVRPAFLPRESGYTLESVLVRTMREFLVGRGAPAGAF